eukprot:3943587-Amphidinium_carterae.1
MAAKSQSDAWSDDDRKGLEGKASNAGAVLDCLKWLVTFKLEPAAFGAVPVAVVQFLVPKKTQKGKSSCDKNDYNCNPNRSKVVI